MKRYQKGSTIVEVLLVVAIVGLAGVIGWLYYDRQQNGKAEESTSQQTADTSKKDQEPKASDADKQAEEKISDDIVVCSVNTAAESGAGLKVAFYGYVKGEQYVGSWVEYGHSEGELTEKTVELPNGSEDICGELLATMPSDNLRSGKHFYRVAAKTADGAVVYSKTDTFIKE